MKKLSLLLAITVLMFLFTSCTTKKYDSLQKKYDSYQELNNGSRLQQGSIIYSFYSALSNASLIGKQIGIIDGDKNHKVFELKGYSPEEWVIEYYDVIMSIYCVYKADTVTEIPHELK